MVFPPFPPPPPPPTLPLPLPPNLSPFHCWEWRHKKEDGEGRQEWFFSAGGRGTASQIKAMVFSGGGGRVKVVASALVFIPQRRVCVLHPANPFFASTPFFADVTRAQTVPPGNAGGKVLIGMKDLKRMCGVCGWVEEEDGFIAFGSAPTASPPSSFRVQGAAVESSRDRGAFTFMSFFSSSFEIFLAPLPNQTHWATWHGLSGPQLLARNCRRRPRSRRRRTH